MPRLKYEVLDTGRVRFPATGHEYAIVAEPINPNGADPAIVERELQAVRNIAVSQNHESRSLSDRDRDSTLAVEVWKREEPDPRRYVVGGLIPENAVTSLYGEGGVKKSFLAVYMALCITSGRLCLDRPVSTGPVLYLDAELDEEEFIRRAYRLSRGFGLQRPPAGLYYRRLENPLGNPNTAVQVETDIAAINPQLTVVDSLMAATAGANLMEANDTTLVFKLLETWGTVLLIDHTAKTASGANLHESTQYGSVFKRNWSRSVIQAIQATEGGAISLRQRKHNFGALEDPMAVALEFSSDQVNVEVIQLDDERLAGIEDHLPPLETTLHTLRGYGDGGATPVDLAGDTGRKVGTIKNHLTTLRKRSLVVPGDSGRWIALSHESRSLKDRDRDSVYTSLRKCSCGSSEFRHNPHGPDSCAKCGKETP